jgi:hypothetical protein
LNAVGERREESEYRDEELGKPSECFVTFGAVAAGATVVEAALKISKNDSESQRKRVARYFLTQFTKTVKNISKYHYFTKSP